MKKTKYAILVALLLLGFGSTINAADYVLTYTSGNTTYYLARNGTSGVTRTDSFDPATCVWSCASNTAGTTAGTLNNSNTYGYLYQTVNGTRYFLSANGNALTLATTASSSNNSYTRWRTNGTYVYNRYSNNTSYYINLANGVARNTTANTASNAKFIQVSHVDEQTSTTVSLNNPTITPASAVTLNSLTSQEFSASTSGTKSITTTPEYYQTTTTPRTYYINGSAPTTAQPSSSTTSNAITQGITYTWSFNDNSTDNGHASIDNNGVLTYYESYDANTNVTIQVTASYSDQTKSATKTITLNAIPVGNPTAISATDISIPKGSTKQANNYTITAQSGYRPYKFVSASSSDTDVATITNDPAGTFSITGVELGSATITLSAYNQSGTPILSTTFTVTVINSETGIVGNEVILNDLEDHSWSYYSDASLPEQMRSLNPADVKITYFGNGNNVSTSSDANPALNTFSATSNTVKVGIDADAHTFIYLKTLERTDGSTSDNPTGRCAYTTIPNPFSVRPTYGSDNTTKWRGFYSWRVKSISGGAIYDAATGGTQIGVGGTIDAETTVYFAPTSEYSMQVEACTDHVAIIH